MTDMIEHHTHYKEIDGYDETVWMTRRDHTLLHQRLRTEKKCNISSDKLRKISNAAIGRTDKRKIYKRDYHKNQIKAWCFTDRMARGVQHRDTIRYNKESGSIYITSIFTASVGKKIKYLKGGNK